MPSDLSTAHEKQFENTNTRVTLVFIVAAFLTLSIVLDFLSPWREAASVIEVVAAATIWLTITRGTLPKSPAILIVLFVYFSYLCINLMIGGELYYLLKLSTYPAIFWMTYTVGKRIGVRYMRYLANCYLLLFGIFLIANVLISIKLGLYGKRHLWAFAHVNLAGSYVVGTVIPLTFLLHSTKRRKILRRFMLIIEAAITRSSGALLSSILVLFSAKRIRIKTIIFLLLSGAIIGLAAWKIGAITEAPYYQKLDNAAKLVTNNKLGELWALAQQRESIFLLGKGGGGSLSWRLYAYSVYAGAISRENPLSLILGKGAGSFKAVWNGYMPHNDFILILHDFGAVATITVVLGLLIIFRRLRKSPLWIMAILILVLCSTFENNIYSDWLMISWATWLGLSFGAMSVYKGYSHGA